MIRSDFRGQIMDAGLTNRVVLVTGASGGIGVTLVRQFVAEGARMIDHYHSGRERAEKAFKDLQGSVHLFGADLTQEADVIRLFAEAERAFGPVEVLIANAGYWPPEDVPVHKMSLDQWNRTLAADLTSVFLCAR